VGEPGRRKKEDGDEDLDHFAAGHSPETYNAYLERGTRLVARP
jgi:hypothetical protein